jgi:cytochrome c peroxidase
MEDFLGTREAPVARRDFGRLNVTGEERDRFKFRVPSLRLVTRTAPYFHDGSVGTLEEAVSIMARYQLGRPITPLQTKRIIQFLETLVGQYEGKSL